MDSERRIRECTFNCHKIIVSSLKKKLAPYLKELIGIWLAGRFDNWPQSSKFAIESFEVQYFKYPAFISIFRYLPYIKLDFLPQQTK